MSSKTTNNQDLIWEVFQNEIPESFDGSLNRLRFLLSKIKSGQMVLNIGCGSGMLEQLAVRHGVDIYSLDPSEKSVLRLRENLKIGNKAKVGYIQQIPFPSSIFDAVIVTEVLEHLTIEIVNSGLIEIRRVLKPGGSLLGTVPSRENLKQQLVVCPSCANRFHRWGHEQSFDPRTMAMLLERHLDVTVSEERVFIPWKILNWKGKLAAVIKLILFYMGVHGSGENIYFEAIKNKHS